MKRILILLFSLVSLLTQAQHVGFPFYPTEPVSITSTGTLPVSGTVIVTGYGNAPVSVSGNVTATVSGTPTVTINNSPSLPIPIYQPAQKRNYSLAERAEWEGLGFFNNAATLPSNYSLNTGATDANTPAVNGILPSTSNYSNFFIANLSKNIYVLSASASCSSNQVVNIGLGSKIYSREVGPSAPLDITFNSTIRPKENYIFSPQGSITPTYSGTAVNNRFVCRSSVIAYHMSADVDYDAPFSMYVLDDSNGEGTAILNPTSAIVSSTLSSENLSSWKIRNWYRANGSRTRIIEKSLAGSGSVAFESRRLKGELRLLEPPTIVFYRFATNDSDATILGTNITNFITWALAEWPADPKTKYPGVRIVIVGQRPRQGDQTQPNANRAAAAAAVANFSNNPYVRYVNAGISFDVNDVTQFSGTEANGSMVHLSVIGQTSDANNITSQLVAGDATSSVKFATFN